MPQTEWVLHRCVMDQLKNGLASHRCRTSPCLGDQPSDLKDVQRARSSCQDGVLGGEKDLGCSKDKREA